MVAHRDDQAAPGDGLELLGFEFQPRQRLWRPTSKKFWRIKLALDFALTPGRRCSGEEIERLAGHLVAIMMVRRDLLCLLHATYQFMRKAGRRRVPLWSSVVKELTWARALLPAMVARTDLPWDPVVSAYDASEWGYGVVESDWEPCQVGEVALPALRCPGRGQRRQEAHVASGLRRTRLRPSPAD